jgi:hypothetical protein
MFPFFIFHSGGFPSGGRYVPHCKHCGEEWPLYESESRIGRIYDRHEWLIPVTIIAVIAVCVFSALTLVDWSMSNDTLVHVLAENLAYVWRLLRRIW